ncbi:dTMP kinase [Henriciella aquimarina]|uniref:dTMP kinase n=1 Tax=Henriciella aquimarina TaxID=545261 RepID=UPI000A0540DD|nr:dTMP kinase [Henriciella aquimarina]
MTTRGRFITVEGGEGTGKSTLIRSLAEALEADGNSLLVTREPGGTPLAEEVRALVLSPPENEHWSALAEALLINAARADHVEKKILPALKAGEWVLCDRFADSTLVYQGAGGVSEDVLLAMQAEVTRKARPDLTLVLDGPVDKLLGRRAQRGTSDVFEARPNSFHEEVRAGFLKIAEREPGRCVIIDALQTPAAMLKDARRAVRERLVAA